MVSSSALGSINSGALRNNFFADFCSFAKEAAAGAASTDRLGRTKQSWSFYALWLSIRNMWSRREATASTALGVRSSW